MTTQELYQAIGVPGREPLECWRKEGVFHRTMAAPDARCRCPQCGSCDVMRRGTVDRIVHAPRIGLDRTVLFIRTPRVQCRCCRRVRNAALPKVVPGCSHTSSLVGPVVDLRKMMTIRDVATYLGTGEGMLRGIDKKYLLQTLGTPRLRDLTIIAINENYVGKRNKYFTIVINGINDRAGNRSGPR